MEFQAEIIIEGPVERAFRASDTPHEQLAWIGSLVEVRVDPGRPWGVGATFVQVHVEGGRRQEFRGEILAYEPERLIGMRLTHADFELESELTFEDLGPRCRVRQTTRLKLRSLMLKAMRAVIGAAVEARIRDDFERLKALVESDA